MKLTEKQKRAFQSFGEKPQLPPKTNTRTAILSDAPVGDGIALGNQLQKIDAADRANQLRELEAAESLAEFDDDPNSETNLKIQKLRAFLGR